MTPFNVSEFRKSEHGADPLFLERWSPRALTGEALPEPVLLRCFEAARWSPSGGNSQPWRFLVARNDSSSFADYLGLLDAGNQVWAKNASALLILIAKKTFLWAGKEVVSSSYSLDAGAAWSAFALQASIAGWQAHGMAGFDRERTRAVLGVPDGYSVEMAIAIGRRAEKSSLPESLQAREFPSARMPLQDIVMEGHFRE